MRPLNIISYNVQLGQKKDKILAWLQTQKNVDIICLQEFAERDIEDCLSVLGKNRFSYAFAPSLKVLRKQCGELTLFRSPLFTLKHTEIITLRAKSANKLALYRRVPRTAILTELWWKKTPILVVNLQLTALTTNAMRYKQLHIILNAIAKKTSATLVIGDFNVPSIVSNTKLIRFMAKHKFTTSETYFSTYRLGFIKYRLDYAFSRGATISKLSTERIRFSDHYPIHIEVK